VGSFHPHFLRKERRLEKAQVGDGVDSELMEVSCELCKVKPRQQRIHGTISTAFFLFFFSFPFFLPPRGILFLFVRHHLLECPAIPVLKRLEPAELFEAVFGAC